MQEIIQTRTITEKLNLLPPMQKQTVYEFIDFLLNKNHIGQAAENITTIENDSIEEKRSGLLDISVWSEEDIEVIYQGQKEMNKWSITEF